MERLDEVVLSHSVAPHHPGSLCTIPPATLVFEERSSLPRKFYKLDCAGFPTELSNPTRYITSVLNDVRDLSFAELSCKQQLFMTEGYKGLFAYNGCTGELEWSVKGELYVGMTTDERGHLFLCVNSGNNTNIKMYTTDGTYLGTLHLNKETFWRPWRIRWCKKTSRLILAHERAKQWLISVIAVKYPM